MGKDTSSMLIISLQASMLNAGVEEKSEEVRDLHQQPHPERGVVYSTVKNEELGFHWEHVNTS